MKKFRKALGRKAAGKNRRWQFVPYDQLSDRIGPLGTDEPEDLGIVLVESVEKAKRRPYHKQKLALILANMRHFALEQSERGVAVRYEATRGGYADALKTVIDELGPLKMMEAAERELREELKPLVEAGDIEVLPHEGWLTSEEDFAKASADGPPWRMDRFYRHVRQETGILMEDGKPVGGKYSFDAENREPWSGKPPAPDPPGFRPDEITQEVGELIEERFADHPGCLDLTTLPATDANAKRMWLWARKECMEHFGPYEDAMSTASRGLFHTRVSQLINIHRLTPKRVVDDVLELDIPLASKEGFVRQVIGWREFVRHVHRATDGFRTIDDDGTPSFLGADASLPDAFWEGTPSGLRCLDTVVDDVWKEAYSHHITRLMILANLATLLDISPRELTDWFWVAYHDAYDWVVEPNVLGMGTFAAGDVMTTKPYVSGAGYIDRMSDYCDGCAFHPKKTCPITPLYWAFLARHRKKLEDNHRVAKVLGSLDRRSDEKKKEDARIFRRVTKCLQAGDPVTPESLSS